MKKILKTLLFYPLKILNVIAISYTSIIKLIYPNLESQWHQFILDRNRKLTSTINHVNSKKNKISFDIATPNITTTSRALTFSTKEPDTLKWIDSFQSNSVFLDVGANIGVYSLYAAASSSKIYTYAFEPSFFNLVELVKNINLNNFQNKLIVISTPLFKNNKISTFIQSKPEAGGAHSSFEVDYGDNGQKLNKNLFYSTLGLNIDFLVSNKIIKKPNYIKIDVDGIEELILLGAQKTLFNKNCREVLIESNKTMTKQNKKINNIMTNSGFILKNTFHIGNERNVNIQNQIWAKSL